MESKTQPFAKELQEIAEIGKVLSHPARLAIVEFLMQQEHCQTGELQLAVPLSRTTIFQHLTALKDAGWIQGEIVGSKIKYCLNPDCVAGKFLVLQNFLNKHKNLNEPCC